MRKIVILTQYFPPEMGAPQSRLFETATGLKKRGWEVLVITAMPNYPTGRIFQDYKGRFSHSDTVDEIPVLRYTLYTSNAPKALPRIFSMLSFSVSVLASWFKLKRFNPSYVLTESPPLTLALSGLILARVCGARHIMNVSDLWPLSAYELGALSKGFVYKRLENLEQFLYRNSFACTGQSRQIVSALEANGSKRTLLYRNGVDVNRFEQLRQTTVSQRKIALRIVYAGLLGVAQGILALCRNIDFSALGAELHIYGEGAEKKDIQAFLECYPFRGIILHSSVDRSSIPITIMQYDITLIPLIKPIFGAVPSKIYEAMAAGLPIIFTGGGEGAEIIREYDTGWVCDPGDYDAIKDKIAEVSKMPASHLEKIRNACIRAARKVFNREVQIEKLSDFLINSDR